MYFDNSGAMMNVGSRDRREDGEHNGIGLVEIHGIFAMNDEFVGGALPFDKV